MANTMSGQTEPAVHRAIAALVCLLVILVCLAYDHWRADLPHWWRAHGGGVQYYIVIDGWEGEFGDYLVTITEYEPCWLECPTSFSGPADEHEYVLHVSVGGCPAVEDQSWTDVEALFR